MTDDVAQASRRLAALRLDASPHGFSMDCQMLASLTLLAAPVSWHTGDVKALTIRQPWAWLIVNGFKDVENRSWSTSYRGPLLIHAAKTWNNQYVADGLKRAMKVCPASGMSDEQFDELLSQRGGIIGQVELVDCVTESRSPWFSGQFGFVLANPKRLPFRPWPGRLGFFDVPE